MARSLADYRKEVKGAMAYFDRQRLEELRKAIEDYQYSMQLEAKAGNTQDVAAHRLSLAATALVLQQQIIPALDEIAEQALDVAGADAVKTACGPRRNWNDIEISSGLILPSKFGGIADRAVRR